MTQSEWISVWEEWADFVRYLFGGEYNSKNKAKYAYFEEDARRAFRQAELENSWFTQENIRFCLDHWSQLLASGKLENWLGKESFAKNPKTVGLVMAGNLPLVGLHDLLCVSLSGHRAQVKLSHKDKALTNWVLNYLAACNEKTTNCIVPVERLENPEVAICTGSDNSARYFEHYFRSIPHIIRKNRTSVAVLHGTETNEERAALGKDLFIYFGLGCRNVTQLWVPKGYDFAPLVASCRTEFENLIHHNAYANNYAYNRTIFLMNADTFYDFGWCMFKASDALYSPIANVNYREYESLDEVREFLKTNEEKIQCVVGDNGVLENALPFGTSQLPELNTFADGVDTLAFLKKV